MIAKYEPSYPSAMASLKQDLTASLTHLEVAGAIAAGCPDNESAGADV